VLDVSLRAYTIKDATNRILGLVGVHTNITDRKRAEAEHAKLEEQLRISQKMEAVGRLAGGIAHDFNNLMTVVLGYSEIVLNKAKENAAIVGDVEQIHKAGVRATNLTRQLLAFSRKQVLKPEVINLNDLMGEIEKMLQRLLGEDIDILLKGHPNLGHVMADKGQLEQVLMNLAINARDAMPTGGNLTLETANVDLDEEYAASHDGVVPGPHVMVAVTDSGCGMNEEVRSRLFEPFFTTKGPGKGTGLGLATVFGIVKQSGGNIRVYSEPGKGTTFRIYLPRVEKRADKDRPSSEICKPSKGDEAILLVEDEASVRGVILSMLEGTGYSILSACNGDEALKICKERKGRIDLLLSDVVMPGISGREMATQLAKVHPETKVLFMSGYTDDAIQHHGVLEPGTAFIEKPFSQVKLTRKIREVLSGKTSFVSETE
jgi:two-component system, cell cycle sensor histidine kinase and response regulator CckA